MTEEDNFMHVSTPVRRTIALLMVVAAATACSDAASAPRAAERPAFDIQALQPVAARSDNEQYGAGEKEEHGRGSNLDADNHVTTLRIDPNVSRTYAFGQNWISFPARSICDPATSGYGPDLWDAPCTPLTTPITVTVRWSARGGYAFAQFSPELRFVSADAGSTSRWVVLSLHGARKLHALSVYKILSNCSTTIWVDESLTDPTLHAWLDPQRNSLVRRVKHFSGYMVAAAYSDLGGMGDASY